MKRVLSIIVLVFALASCKKEPDQINNHYLQQVKTELKDSMKQTDYNTLDFDDVIEFGVDSIGLHQLRIPFKEKSIGNDYVILRINETGNIQRGRIIHIDGGIGDSGIKGEPKTYNGSIEISSLNRITTLHSAIVDGYMVVFHPKSTMRSQMLMAKDPQDVLVVGTIYPYGVSYSDWIMLQSYFYNSGGSGGSGSAYYAPMSGGGTGGSGSSMQQWPVIHMDIESYVNHPAIDLNKYLKCFDNIPDAGAICSIELFTDIPVDNDPTKLFNWQTNSPGHCFLQIKKSNNGQYCLQNIGFYPQANWAAILDANPVDSKFVDDGQHEFNASIKMTLTPYQLKLVLMKAKELATMKYDMDEFNCADYALEVFNSARNIPLEIPRYAIPGGIGNIPSRTPQGLYRQLRTMKQTNNPEAANINLPGYKAWVAKSDGPCN